MPEHSEKPPASSPSPSPAGAKPRRRRARRFLRGLCVGFILLAFFHRPLLEIVFRLALIKVAASHHIKLDAHFSGSFFTNLEVRDIAAGPNGKGPTPVQKISIEAVRLEYSIPMLLRHGLAEFLRSYEIHNADLVFVAEPSKTKEESEQKKSLAQDLNNVLGQPALYSDRVQIDNFNITVRSDTDVTEVKGVQVLFDPWAPGYLRIERIKAPGLPAWENLSAKTSYAKRNLSIEGLALSPEVIVDEFNFDASQRAQGKGGVSLAGRFFGGAARVAVSGAQLNKKGRNLQKSYATTLKIDAAGIDVHAAAAYFNARNVPPVTLAWLTTTFAGEPESPRTWKGDLAARVEGFDFGKIKVDAAEAEIAFHGGRAQVTSGTVELGRNALQLTASAELPESINDFSKTDGSADFRLEAPDLGSVTGVLLPGQSVAGAVSGKGQATIRDGTASGDATLAGAQIGNEQFGAASLKLNLHGAKPLNAPSGSPLEGLATHVTAELTGLRANGVAVDSAALDAKTSGDQVTLDRAEAARGENRVEVQGMYRLPRNAEDFLHTTIDGQFTIHAPKLETFGLGARGEVLSGHVDGSGRIQTANGDPAGSVQIDGGDFAFGQFKAKAFNAAVHVANNEAEIEKLELQVDANDQISVAGKAGLQSPNAYEGAVLVLFKNLGALHPLLETFGLSEEVGGSADFMVEGKGNLRPEEHRGDLKLSIDKARYGKIDLREARIAAAFGPDFAETSQLRVVSGATSFEGVVEWRDRRLKVHDINLRQGAQQALSGYVSIPFEPGNAELVPFEKRIAANVNATQLDLDKLFASLGQTAPASGNVTANLVAGGTVFEPSANLKISARGLKSKAAAQLDPAEFDLVAHYSEKELSLDATARQKDIQPLTIKGRAPLDLQAALQHKKIDVDLPLDLTVKLPPTSLALLPKVIPAVRSAAGTASLDARIAGTVGKPQLSGSAVIKVDYARMKSEGAPAIGTLQGNLAFTQDSLVVQKFHGEVGGGAFDLSGKVQFAKITEPVFDLRLKSNSVLVMRNDSMTVRVDTDIAATGPLAAGKIAGAVWVTQSRFFREIDILPIALPGRPKPQPRAAPSQGSFALGPPFNNWTFDLAIKTRANDPFQVRGNLANGAAMLDLKFGGTGQQPWLDGSVHIENFVASLPFSKLNVTRGFVTFSRDAPFEPTLDLSAESNLREYHISAYIYGAAKDPQLSLTSEPPLPQQDILSLLATGATSSELTGSSDVLASRAAVLLFQQLYRKVFKRKDPAEGVPLLDRFSVDVGAVDNRTGREEVSASFKLGAQLYLVGDVDVTGAFAGRVKYLLRFK